MIEPDLREPTGPSPLRSRLGSLLLIWGLSIGALGVVAMLIRWWLR